VTITRGRVRRWSEWDARERDRNRQIYRVAELNSLLFYFFLSFVFFPPRTRAYTYMFPVCGHLSLRELYLSRCTRTRGIIFPRGDLTASALRTVILMENALNWISRETDLRPSRDCRPSRRTRRSPSPSRRVVRGRQRPTDTDVSSRKRENDFTSRAA